MAAKKEKVTIVTTESGKWITRAMQALTPRLIRAKDAYIFLGSEKIVRDCENAGWMRPVIRRHKLVLYSVADLHICADRLEQGQYPEGYRTEIPEPPSTGRSWPNRKRYGLR